MEERVQRTVRHQRALELDWNIQTCHLRVKIEGPLMERKALRCSKLVGLVSSAM